MPGNNKKWTPELVTRARSGPGKLHVVLELSPTREGAPGKQKLSGKAAAEAMKQSFELQSQPLIAKVEQLGGRLINSGWLSGSLEVELSGEALADLSCDQAVQRVDVVRRPERE